MNASGVGRALFSAFLSVRLGVSIKVHQKVLDLVLLVLAQFIAVVIPKGRLAVCWHYLVLGPHGLRTRQRCIARQLTVN